MSDTWELMDGSWDRKCRLQWGPQLERERAPSSACAMFWKLNPEEMGALGGAEKGVPASGAGPGGEKVICRHLQEGASFLGHKG